MLNIRKELKLIVFSQAICWIIIYWKLILLAIFFSYDEGHSESFQQIMTRLTTRENIINNQHQGSFKSYIGIKVVYISVLVYLTFPHVSSIYIHHN